MRRKMALSETRTMPSLEANDTWSGLWSSGWSRDDRCATSIAESLRTGVTFFNNHNATAVMSIPT